MAHAAKFARADVNKLVAHDERTEDDTVKSRRNETIDPDRTHLNYSFESIGERDEERFFANLDEDSMNSVYEDMNADDIDEFLSYGGSTAEDLSENTEEAALVGRKYSNITPLGYIKEFGSLPDISMSNRKDLKAVVSWVVTKPENVTEDEQERFFAETYAFLRKRYCDGVEKAVGMSPCISAVVHLDETTPHMHFKFIPTYFDKKTEKWRVSAKEVLNRRDMQTFHKDLSAHMSRVFGRDIGIENRATQGGNKSVTELKKQTAHEVEILERHLNTLKNNEKALRSDLENVNEKLRAAEESLSQSVTERLRAYQRVVARLPKNIRDQIERDVDKELHPSRYRSRSHDFDER